MPKPLDQTQQWPRLLKHAKQLSQVPLRGLFQNTLDRSMLFSREACGIRIDFSRQKITQETLALLCELAQEQELSEHFNALFSGNFMNKTENRPAFHPGLRCPEKMTSREIQEVHTSLEKMAQIVQDIHNGVHRGYTGEPITDIVNLGIGGSYLGPALACEALRDFAQPTHTGHPLSIHFVANLHACAFDKCLARLNPKTTLFLVSSKSFNTRETLSNFARAKEWFTTDLSQAFHSHFIAITANVDKALNMGFDTENILPFWDWVGGRFSVWSAIGLPVALSIGMDNFRAFLQGGHQMDRHVANAPIEDNLAVLLALIDIWQINCLNIHNHAILSYHDNFSYLTPYLQQLIMESNGKNRDHDNVPIHYTTAPIVWGGIGSLGQHAYYQLLHQGTIPSMIDFIVVADTEKEVVTSALSQAQVLVEGDNTPATEAAYLIGNNPSNLIWLETLSPGCLGAFLALCEHRTFAQAMLWHINPFDQWGVERGKVIQEQLYRSS